MTDGGHAREHSVTQSSQITLSPRNSHHIVCQLYLKRWGSTTDLSRDLASTERGDMTQAAGLSQQVLPKENLPHGAGPPPALRSTHRPSFHEEHELHKARRDSHSRQEGAFQGPCALQSQSPAQKGDGVHDTASLKIQTGLCQEEESAPEGPRDSPQENKRLPCGPGQYRH